MIEIDEAIIQLDYRKDFATKNQIEAIDLAINTLKQKQWLIDQYEHEVDLLEQDLADSTVFDRMVFSTRIAVYKRVLKDLKGDGEE